MSELMSETLQKDTVAILLEMLPAWLGDDGFDPQPGIGLDSEGHVRSYALAFGGDSSAFYNAFMDAVSVRNTIDVLFTSDRYALPDQDIPTTEFLAILRWHSPSLDEQGCFDYGVLPYDTKARTFHPIDWDNAFWVPKLRAERSENLPCLIRIK